jgi:hypothetical protein
MTGDRPTAVPAARFEAQLLGEEKAVTLDGVVERLLAVQAQDARAFRLAVRARTRGVHVRDVDAALDDGRLIVSWLNRGTLHLVSREDYWWLHALTTPQLMTGCRRRLAQEGVDPDAADRGVTAILRALQHGPLLRSELREHVAADGVRTDGQALVHVLFLATLLGHIVRGPVRDGEQAFVLVADWLGKAPLVDRHKALSELARRYLRSHPYADDRDLARWANVPLADARRGLAACAPTPDQPATNLPPPTLLGAFEPVLLGWRDRAWLIPEPALSGRLVTDNGIFRPFLLVDGAVAGIWSLGATGPSLSPFADLSDDVVTALHAEAAAVVAFLH